MHIADTLIGHQLSNYRIERLLGKGGMASVYYAVDIQLQRPAAVKVIDDRHRDDYEYAERFVHEARAVASWRHQNIPQVYQAGMENGIYFYAMEYIEGMDLEKVLLRLAQRGELLPLGDVLMVGRSIASALDFAHKKGAIHRDVKPSNVMIAEDDRILLTDFGLVLVVQKGTRGEVFGSPHYIAPEQARNSADAVPESDLYALGVILYEMLVGRVPFDDPSPASLAIKHITDEPPLPRQLNPSLSPEIEAVLLKALRKQPSDRYGSGRELMDALEDAIHAQQAQWGGDEPAPTLVELPGVPESRPGSTYSRLRLSDLTKSVPPTQAGADPPYASAAPQTHAFPNGGNVDVRVRPGARRSPKKTAWIGCLAGIAAVGAFLFFGAALAYDWLKDRGEQAAFSITTTSTPTDQPSTTQPAETAANPIGVVPIASSATPTATSTRTSTQNPAPTVTRTPTATRTVTPTPTKSIVYKLVFVKQRDESMFVVNGSTSDFPMDLLLLRNDRGDLLGEEWEVSLLEPGQCVAVWKEEGNPSMPRGLQCELVGKRLEMSGGAKFWTSDFEVLFRDDLLGKCKKGKNCEYQFLGPPL